MASLRAAAQAAQAGSDWHSAAPADGPQALALKAELSEQKRFGEEEVRFEQEAKSTNAVIRGA